ncbi:MAG: hypothetical protein IJ647_01885 [Prevotella sp.]|nr:hypothetical protein [Prevotella sp.]
MKKKEIVVHEPPVVELGSFEFSESNYTRGKERWMASTLYRACHNQGLEPFELPLAGIDLSVLHFSVSSADEFIWQMKRCMECDTNIPIVLDNLGQIADGAHRVCMAIANGEKTILAYRLQTMPEPDFVESNTESK